MVKTSLVIWDWNGTLLDDTALCYSIANHMRQERGMPPLADIETYRGLFRFPVIEYYRDMGYTFETESYEDISVEFVSEYARRLSECALQPHALTTLSAVRASGRRQVLLSATGADRLAAQAAQFGVDGLFDDIVGAENNLAGGKAAQACALIADCGVQPDEVLFVGDTDHDYQVSRAAGCRCLLLTCGHQPAERLAALCAPLIDDLSAVLPAL